MSPAETDAFLREVVAILLDYIRASNDRKSLVVEFHHPTELRRILGHLLPVGQDHVGLDEILRECRETLKYCVRTGRIVVPFDLNFKIKFKNCHLIFSRQNLTEVGLFTRVIGNTAMGLCLSVCLLSLIHI